MGKGAVSAMRPTIRSPSLFTGSGLSLRSGGRRRARAGVGAKEYSIMTRGGKVFSVIVVVLLGLWGCARGPVGPSGQAERIHTLETKCSKLEDDYRSVAGARDQASKQVDALKAERARLQKDLAEKQRERDAL